jgi:hypothetical protein
MFMRVHFVGFVLVCGLEDGIILVCALPTDDSMKREARFLSTDGPHFRTLVGCLCCRTGPSALNY